MMSKIKFSDDYYQPDCQRNHEIKRQNYSFENLKSDVVYSHSGELDVDYIFFAILPSCYELDSDYLQKSRLKSYSQSQNTSDSIECLKKEIGNTVDDKQYVSKTLKLCLELGLQSIAFPVICSDVHTNKCYNTITMLLAVKKFLDDNFYKCSNLNLITFTANDKEYVKSFTLALSKLSENSEQTVQSDEPLFWKQNSHMKFINNSLINRTFNSLAINLRIESVMGRIRMINCMILYDIITYQIHYKYKSILNEQQNYKIIIIKIIQTNYELYT